MAASLKVLFVDGDQVRPVPFLQFDQLRAGDPSVRFPSLAGKRVRCALAVVESQRGRRGAVEHIDYVLLPFGSDGRLDMREMRRAKWLAVNELSGTLGSVFDPGAGMTPYIVATRHSHDFRWVPTQTQIDAVIASALNDGA
jgi:hypothetical protein